jgi:hypothetical protein
MSVSSIGSSGSSLSQWDPSLFLNQGQSTSSGGTAATTSTNSPPPPPPPGGGLMSAIMEALQESGVGSTSSTTGSDSTTGSTTSTSAASSSTSSSTSSDATAAAAAVQQFMQSLMAALQVQAESSGSLSTESPAISGAGSSSCSTPDTASTSSTDSTSSADSTASTADATLQTSFNNLMTALGGGSGSSSLSGFLQAVANNLEGGSPAGNFIGYGLGLAIARRCVEAHGGTIRADNRPGGGLCVEIMLPWPRNQVATHPERRQLTQPAGGPS